VTLVGPIAYFTRICWQYIDALQLFSSMKVSGLRTHEDEMKLIFVFPDT